MKKKLLFTLLLCTLISIESFSQAEGERYYYSLNKKIFLREIEDKMVVCFQSKHAEDVKARLQTERIEQQYEGIYIVNVAGNRKESLKRDLSQIKGVKSIQPMYRTYSGVEVGITDEIVMKFHNNVSQQQIDELHSKHQVQIKETTGLWYLVIVPSQADALEIANQYQLSGLVEYCHPDFLAKIENYQTIPNDPYFENQFYLHNTGQSIIKVKMNGSADIIRSGAPGADIRAPEAWDITKGNSDIVVAVLDSDGFTHDHPDLPASRQVWLNGSDFAENPPGNNPSTVENGNHANACAGIIAATHNNNEGIAGIAPNCKIMPVRIPSETTAPAITRVANAFRFAKNNGAHVISCSWGYEVNKNSSYGFPEPDLFPEIVAAITEVTTQGREGKGCVVVFAASNSANHAAGDPGFVAFPANVQVPGVLTVGASDRYDQQANYSPTSVLGTTSNQIVDIVAPSNRAWFCTPSYGDDTEGNEIWTIDIPDGPNMGYPAGYNPPITSGCSYPLRYIRFPDWGTNYDAYTGYFGGTSAAAPQVAGVAALILSENPNLTQLEVSNIIKSSARKPAGYTYAYQIGMLYNNTWNPQMGYGVLNAHAAVQGAKGNLLIEDLTLNNGDPNTLQSSCGVVYIKDVTLQGNAKMTVLSSQRIVIKSPFKAAPTGDGYFYARVIPCSSISSLSSGLRSSPSPEVQHENPTFAEIIQPVIRDAFLAQNIPNPVREQTIIPYYIPESFRSASLLFTTAMGVPVKHIPVYTGGEGEAEVSVSELPPGIYLYSLLVDGRVVATKRMQVLRQ